MRDSVAIRARIAQRRRERELEAGRRKLQRHRCRLCHVVLPRLRTISAWQRRVALVVRVRLDEERRAGAIGLDIGSDRSTPVARRTRLARAATRCDRQWRHEQRVRRLAFGTVRSARTLLRTAGTRLGWQRTLRTRKVARVLNSTSWNTRWTKHQRVGRVARAAGT